MERTTNLLQLPDNDTAFNNNLHKIAESISVWTRSVRSFRQNTYYHGSKNYPEAITNLQKASDDCLILRTNILNLDKKPLSNHIITRIKVAANSTREKSFNYEEVEARNFRKFLNQTSDFLYIIIQLYALNTSNNAPEDLANSQLIEITKIAYNIKNYIKRFKKFHKDILKGELNQELGATAFAHLY